MHFVRWNNFLVSGWILFFCFTTQKLSGQHYDSLRMDLLERVKIFIKQDLNLTLHEEFYTKWSDRAQKISYVYVSQNDSLTPPVGIGNFIYVGEDSLKADSIMLLHETSGHQVMHYRTAGTSAAQLNHALWNYPAEAFVFIVLHESIHVHLQQTEQKIPYEYEEALGDAVANFYTPVILKNNKEEFKASIHQQKVFSKLYTSIKRAEVKFYRSGNREKFSFMKTQNEICRWANRGNVFHRDRFLYPLNNAYLMRYHSYVYHYDDLYRQLKNGESVLQIIQSKVQQ